MDLHTLRVFSTVASEKSFSRAATTLGRTQPAIQIAGVAPNLRSLSGAAARQQSAFDSIVSHTDSILARLERGEGTLGRLTRDTTLYHESVSAVRSLRSMLDDMQRNPRKYFSFSVF